MTDPTIPDALAYNQARAFIAEHNAGRPTIVGDGGSTFITLDAAVDADLAAGHIQRPTGDAEALVATINYLRADEGDVVTLVCDNPDFNGQPNNAVDCCGGWTDWKDLRFTGDSLFAAVSAAAGAKAVETCAPAPFLPREADQGSFPQEAVIPSEGAAKRLTNYPDYINDPEGLERIRAGLLEVQEWHDLPGAIVNCNSLARLLDTIEMLRAKVASREAEAPVSEAVAWRWRYDDDGLTNWSYGATAPGNKSPHRSVMEPTEVRPLFDRPASAWRPNPEAVAVLQRHLPNLDAAAMPTKCEVFVVCGSEAAEMRDAILALSPTEGSEPLTSQTAQAD